MKGKSAVPVSVNALEITGAGGAARTSERVPETVPPIFVAPMATENVPVAAGVPEISPVDELTANPDGSPVALKLVGALLALIW